MPLYEYRCDACETRFERYVRAFGETVACPDCGSQRVEKLLSTFATSVSGSEPAPSGGGCCGGGCGCAH